MTHNQLPHADVHGAALNRLQRPGVALAVIDIQEKLLPSIAEKDRVVRNSLLLVRGLQVLNVPVVVTEQYRKGLGPTVSEIAQAVNGFSPIEKLAFSACGSGGFVSELKEQHIRQVVLCGIEAHVCVTQTCLDLLQAGYSVFVPADAVGSRTPENHQAGLGRMRDAGAVIASTEMVIFELLREAGTGEFKQMLPLLK